MTNNLSLFSENITLSSVTEEKVMAIEKQFFGIDLFYGKKLQQRPLKKVLLNTACIGDIISSTAKNLEKIDFSKIQITIFSEAEKIGEKNSKFWLGVYSPNQDLYTVQEILNSVGKEKLIIKAEVNSAVHYFLCLGEVKPSPKIPSLCAYKGTERNSNSIKVEFENIEDVWNF